MDARERDGERGSGPRRAPGTRALLWWAALGGVGLLGLVGLLASRGFFGSDGCSAGELAALTELPRHDGLPHEPGPVGPGDEHCNVRYTVDAPREEVLAYYSERLGENGWEVEPEGATMLTARRDGYRLRVERGARLDPPRGGGKTQQYLVKDVVELRVASEGRGS